MNDRPSGSEMQISLWRIYGCLVVASIVGLFAGSLAYAISMFIEFGREDLASPYDLMMWFFSPLFLTGIAAVFCMPFLCIIHAVYSMWIVRFLIRKEKSLLWWVILGVVSVLPVILSVWGDGDFVSYIIVSPLVGILFLRWLIHKKLNAKSNA